MQDQNPCGEHGWHFVQDSRTVHDESEKRCTVTGILCKTLRRSFSRSSRRRQFRLLFLLLRPATSDKLSIFLCLLLEFHELLMWECHCMLLRSISMML